MDQYPKRSITRVLATVLSLVTLACGPVAEDSSGPRRDSPRVPVPADVLRKDVSFVDSEERDGVARAQVTAVVQGSDPDTFRSAWTVAADRDGRAFVLDFETREVVAFDSDGAFIDRQVVPGDEATGAWGASSITVAGTQVLVTDLARGVLLRFSLDLELLESDPVPYGSGLEQVFGLRDGTVVGRYVLDIGDRISVSRFDMKVDEIVRFAVVDMATLADPVGLLPRPLLAVDPSGRVYLAMSGHYQVVAFDEDGHSPWSIQVTDMPREVLTEEVLQRVLPADFRGRELERTRRVGRASGANIRDDVEAIEYPEYLPALSEIEVDGRGRLWVFPWSSGPAGEPPYPVDVYSRDGERIFAGRSSIRSWDAASGDHVYRIEKSSPGAFRLVRYLLTLPGDPGHQD